MQFNFARFTCTYYIYDRNFALHYPKRSESIRVLRVDRRSVMIIRVNVNLKSELVEDREGKSTLYGVICCCDDRLLSSSGGSCIWAAELQPPTRFCDLFFFRIFDNVNISHNVIVHTLFTNAPVYVAEKTNFPILLALN